MSLGEIAIYIFYCIMLTTIAGSLFSLLWLLLRRCFGGGNVLLLSYIQRIAVQFYLIPVLFFAVLWSRGDNTLIWPWLGDADPHVIIFHRSELIFWIAVISLTIWAVGNAAVLIRYWKERRALREFLGCTEAEKGQSVLECFERTKKRLGIHKKIVLLRSCEGSMPCTVGIFQKKVIVPKRVPEYSDRELEIIFAHELMHCRRHDLFFKAEFLAANFIHAVNPLVHLMRQLNLEYTEIACDLMTCSRMQDVFTHKEYGRVLLQFAVKKEEEDEKEPSHGIVERKSLLEKRVQAMLWYERKKPMKKGAAALIAALFVAGSSMTAFAAGNGIAAIQDDIYWTTSVKCEGESAGITNTLPERVLTAEEFAAYGSIVMEEGLSLSRAGGTIEWPMSAGATYSSTSFYLNKGDTVSVAIWTDPENQTIEAGIVNINGGAVSVTGTDKIGHSFTAWEDGHYRFFVKNCSSIRITVSGAYTH